MQATADTGAPLRALTIAGFDPSSGAGISADLLVFASLSVFATSAITALTVQSTLGVRGVQPVPADLLTATLDCLEQDLPPAGVKIGMLADAAQVDAVADYLVSVRSTRSVTVVLDPVLRSSSGATLLSDAGVEVLKERLLPLVDVITPNLAETQVLSGLPCMNRQQMEACAASLLDRYPGLQVVVTGGHLDAPADLWAGRDGMEWVEGEHIATRATHGTGCVFSSALLASRLQGKKWPECVQSAKQYVRRAMLTAAPHGGGRGPLNLLFGG